MALTKKPVTGMKDILPQEKLIRDYVIEQIREVYRGFGYTPIETPVVESLSNLLSKQGGDNEKLIFKIMKRGEKFNPREGATEEELADSGLRYDLTVPLVRYYAAHANELAKPFKALQIGPVFRADRPQRGRFRQFYQCDIDILGESSNLAEIDLILATTTLLGRLGFKDFTVHINDRRLLKAMAAYSGFAPEDYDKVFIIIDKYDKIGWDGVREELLAAGYAPQSVDRYLAMFTDSRMSTDGIAYVSELLKDVMDPQVGESLQEITRTVQSVCTTPFTLLFDPALVRGMSYYTGTIFEIELAGLGCAAGGGGRYDEMVGKFTNMQVPACGFSIGFERIITILLEQGFTVPGVTDKTAYLVEKGMPADRMREIMAKATSERQKGKTVLVTIMNKNKKFQKDQLSADGYTAFEEFFCR